MLKGPGRSGTEQNHIEAEFAMKGTHPPQAGLSFHGFFKIAGLAGEFGSAPQASGLLEQTSESVPQASGLLEQIFAPATAGLGIGRIVGEPVPKIPRKLCILKLKLGIEWPFSSVCPKKSDFLGIFFRKSSLMPKPWKSDG
mgnify:CR=1 FL=1